MAYSNVPAMIPPRRMVRTPVPQALSGIADLIRITGPRTRPHMTAQPSQTGLQGRSPYAAKFDAAPARARLRAAQWEQAQGDVLPQTAADVEAIDAAIQRSADSMTATEKLRADFAAAGEPISDDMATRLLIERHDAEVAASAQAYAVADASRNALPVLTADGTITMVDMRSDPAILRAAQNVAAQADRPPTGANPVARAATSPSPEEQAAAAMFGDTTVSPGTVAQAQMAGVGSLKPIHLALLAVGAWFLLKGRV